MLPSRYAIDDPLVDLSIAEGKLTPVALTKLWAFKNSLEIPLVHIASVRAEPETPRGWYHGIRMPGTKAGKRGGERGAKNKVAEPGL